MEQGCKVRIALVSIIKPFAGSGDGVTEYAYQLYRNMKRRHKVDLYYTIDSAAKNNVAGLVYTSMALNRKMKELAGKEYDIIHIVNHEIGYAAKTLRKMGTNAKIVTTVHDLLRFQKGYHKGLLQFAYSRLVADQMRQIPKYSDFVLFDSKQTEEAFYRIFPKAENSAVITLGVSDQYIKVGKHAEKRSGFRVGYIGSFAFHKNVQFILRTAKEMHRVKDVEFYLYGSGIQKDRLLSDIKEQGLNNVRMMGFADEARKIAIYDSFNVFFFPSLYEGFGLPIIEAQARGLPVIIYKQGRVPDEVRKYCLEAETPEDAVRIIMNIKSGGRSKAHRKEAARYARRFTWRATAVNTLNTYRHILNGG